MQTIFEFIKQKRPVTQTLKSERFVGLEAHGTKHAGSYETRTEYRRVSVIYRGKEPSSGRSPGQGFHGAFCALVVKNWPATWHQTNPFELLHLLIFILVCDIIHVISHNLLLLHVKGLLMN